MHNANHLTDDGRENDTRTQGNLTWRGVLAAAIFAVAAAVAIVWLDPAGMDALAQGGLRGAEVNLEQFDATNLRAPAEDIRRGGPGKDGIPSLTTEAARDHQRDDTRLYGEHPPRIEPVHEATIPGDARVVSVTVGNESRAYPVPVLTWHEAVNDVLGGEPIAVIYCPLCDSAAWSAGRSADGRWSSASPGCF